MENVLISRFILEWGNIGISSVMMKSTLVRNGLNEDYISVITD